MKMTKHTPGPWHVCDECSDIMYCGGVFDADGVSILARDNPSESRANAVLMAAAPDLLAATKLVLAELKELPEDDVHAEPWMPRDVGDVLRAAIAKAEGR